MEFGSRTYRRRDGSIAADLGEELALLDMASGSYLGFNETAAFAWRLIERPRTLDFLCDALTAEFDVDQEQCRASLTRLLEELDAAGLLAPDSG